MCTQLLNVQAYKKVNASNASPLGPELIDPSVQTVSSQ